MRPEIRKLRGVLGIALTWAALFAAFFALLIAAISIVDPDSIDPGEGALVISAFAAIIGLVSGLAFGVLLMLAEGGRAIREIPLARAAIWGLLASALFPLLAGKYDQVFVMCPIGVLVALVVMTLARRQERRDPSRPQRLRDLCLACVGKLVREAVQARRAGTR